MIIISNYQAARTSRSSSISNGKFSVNEFRSKIGPLIRSRANLERLKLANGIRQCSLSREEARPLSDAGCCSNRPRVNQLAIT